MVEVGSEPFVHPAAQLAVHPVEDVEAGQESGFSRAVLADQERGGAHPTRLGAGETPDIVDCEFV